MIFFRVLTITYRCCAIPVFGISKVATSPMLFYNQLIAYVGTIGRKFGQAENRNSKIARNEIKM